MPNRVFFHTAKSALPGWPLICGDCGDRLDPTGVPDVYTVHNHETPVDPQTMLDDWER